jgi:hypothetical protein
VCVGVDQTLCNEETMPKEPVREVRRGTKSCVECRQRKIKCIWPDGGRSVCSHCQQRNLSCVPQVSRPLDPNTVRLTSRHRINQLEETVSQLWNAVRELQAHTSIPGSSLPQSANPISIVGDEQDRDSDSEASESLPRNPPTHLKRLFDNEVLDSRDYPSPVTTHSSNRAADQRINDAREAIQALIPSRSDVEAIATHASGWLGIYNELFPSTLFVGTQRHLLAQNEKMRGPQAPLMAVAAFVLSLAIAVLQGTEDTAELQLQDVVDGHKFIQEVSTVVETVIVRDEVLAGTVEGIEISLMCLRL